MHQWTYNLHKNFSRVYPQFVDTRLISHFVDSSKIDISNIANTISHLLIYQDALSNNYQSILIEDMPNPLMVNNKNIYVYNNINISYGITKDDINTILSLLPLSVKIQDILSDLGYSAINMGYYSIKNNIWDEVFLK